MLITAFYLLTRTLPEAFRSKFFCRCSLRGVTPAIPLPKSTTEHLRKGASEIIGESGCEGLFFYGLSIQSFPEKWL